MSRWETRDPRPLAVTPKMGKDQVLKAVRREGSLLKDVSESLRADRDVVLAAVASDSSAFCFASEALRGDKEIVEEALRGRVCTQTVPHIPPSFWGDREVVLSVMRNLPFSIEDTTAMSMLLAMPRELQYDPEIALAARGRTAAHQWRYVTPELYDFVQTLTEDRDSMLSVIANDGGVLRAAGPQIQGDREVVLAAVSSKGSLIQFATPQLRQDVELVMKAAETMPSAWQYLQESLESDRERYLDAGRSGHKFLNYLKPPLALDKGFVLEAVRLADQQLTWSHHLGQDEELTKADRSRIAFRGEPGAPVARVKVSPSPNDEFQLNCSVHFELSGRVTELSMASEATLETLASEIVLKRPKTMKGFRRVAMFFMKDTQNNNSNNDDNNNSSDDPDDGDGDDEDDFGEPVIVTPWDWNRPLKDFVAASK